MATSVYFNNYSAAVINQQRLMEDLVVESIKINGHDVKYMPREVYDSTDEIYGESVNSKFNRAYTMEMYLSNVEGYEGDGDFFSKFGLEIRDNSNFIVSRKTFEKYVPSTLAARPREGDLIYVPVLEKIFEIKFVEEELMFFSLGKRQPYIFELRCELFRYSSENINTGDEDIDNTQNDNAYTVQLSMGNGSGNYMTFETVYQGANVNTATAVAAVKEWNPTTKILEVINIQGEFANTNTIIGVTSNASYVIATLDEMGNFVDYDHSDNRTIQDEANTFIDFSEVNPFGLP